MTDLLLTVLLGNRSIVTLCCRSTSQTIDPAWGACFKQLFSSGYPPAQYGLTLHNCGLKHHSFLFICWYHLSPAPDGSLLTVPDAMLRVNVICTPGQWQQSIRISDVQEQRVAQCVAEWLGHWTWDQGVRASIPLSLVMCKSLWKLWIVTASVHL